MDPCMRCYEILGKCEDTTCFNYLGTCLNCTLELKNCKDDYCIFNNVDPHNIIQHMFSETLNVIESSRSIEYYFRCIGMDKLTFNYPIQMNHTSTIKMLTELIENIMETQDINIIASEFPMTHYFLLKLYNEEYETVKDKYPDFIKVLDDYNMFVVYRVINEIEIE